MLVSELPLYTGIYAIHNVAVSNTAYIGQAKIIQQRCRIHLVSLCKGEHYNKQLQAAYNQYGGEAFDFRVLERYSGSGFRRSLDAAEGAWVVAYKKAGYHLYNIAPTSPYFLGDNQTWKHVERQLV